MESTRLSPGVRRTFQVLGPLFIVAGMAFLLLGPVLAFTGSLQDAQEASSVMVRAGVFMLVALPTFAAGGIMTNLGYLKPVAAVTATESSGALEHAGGLGGAAVKLRCRGCGALDAEDARFCSACGDPM